LGQFFDLPFISAICRNIHRGVQQEFPVAHQNSTVEDWELVELLCETNISHLWSKKQAIGLDFNVQQETPAAPPYATC